MTDETPTTAMPSFCCPDGTRSERKRAQVLEGAREVLLADGYEGASVDDIARTAGISKATLYRHFPDKSALFAAVAQQECARQAALHPDIDCAGRCLREVLAEVARDTMAFGLSDFGQNVFRIAVAEAARFPELGEKFYAAGPERSCKRLAPVLAAAAKRGAITAPDPTFAAEMFLSMCKSVFFTRRLFGVGPAPEPAEIDAHIGTVVELFLKAFDFRPMSAVAPEDSPAA